MGDCEFDGTYCQEHGQQWHVCFADLRARLEQAETNVKQGVKIDQEMQVELGKLKSELVQAEARVRQLEDDIKKTISERERAYADVAALHARVRRLEEALEECWCEVHAEHDDINSPKWVGPAECSESACVRARAALTRENP